MCHSQEGKLLLPTLPSAEPLPHAVLFAFDDRAFPFQNHVQTHLIPGRNPRLVLRHGPAGAHDEVVRFYGSVLRIGGILHLWYFGSYGAPYTGIGYGHVTRRSCLCYATSTDGVHWDKPDLGLVEFNGSKHNNIVEFPEPEPRPAAAILYDPEDPDPDRRFKMAYEATRDGTARFCVAFSADGLHWRLSERNPVGPFLEMAGITKFRGVYYVSGQAALTAHRPFRARRLATFASTDFEHWSPCSAVGLDRAPDLVGPSTEADWNQYEEIHLGAALWDRQNVLLGIYGQWHGHPSGDRRQVSMDLGLALSHDAIHYHEPIPGFRFVPAREQPESPANEVPALMQGQGMENLGDETLYWYSLWRPNDSTGVCMVSWERDRLGFLQPFRPYEARAISCPIQVLPGGSAKAYVNASGLGKYSQLHIHLVDEGFHPVTGYCGSDAAVIAEDGLCVPVRWRTGDALLSSQGRLRFDVRFEGIRPEDCRLHAIYIVAE